MKKKHVIIAIIIVLPLNLWDVFFFSCFNIVTLGLPSSS
jgi:hypothetical protein